MVWIYLSGRAFKVNTDKEFSDPRNLTCGSPQGSILGQLLFLLYMNDLPQAVKCDLFLYVDDTYLTFQHENVKEIEDQLNLIFSSLCDWFIDNKLSIHLGEDTNNSILFGTKFNIKRAEPLNIVYGNVKIKQYAKVTSLVSILDESLSGESMALYILDKINSRFINKLDSLTSRFGDCYVTQWSSTSLTILVLHDTLFYEKIYRKYYRFLIKIIV